MARDAPYDGRGALALARQLPEDEATRDRRIALAKRAIRFGAGAEALDLLASLDPAAALEFTPAEPAKPAAGSEPSAGLPEPAKADSES